MPSWEGLGAETNGMIKMEGSTSTFNGSLLVDIENVS
jgi:hypothetical protein